MKLNRLLAGTAAAAAIFTFAACGADDDIAPTSAAPSSPAFSDDDQVVTDENLRAELEKVALGEVGQGTVTEVEHNTPDADDNDADDLDHAYQVEVNLTDGEDVTVDIAEDMSVVRVED